MIKEFDPSNLRNLRDDLQSALLSVASKHGIKISVGSAKYQPEQATFKIELVTVGVGGVDNKAKAEFDRYCSSFGLRPEHFGGVIKFGRDSYKISGLKPRAPKRPILATSVTDGKTYILPESAVASLQSAAYKNLYGGITSNAPTFGTCVNTNSFDAKFNPIGKCTRTATTHRKTGFGKGAKAEAYCTECAHLIDESRAEMEAEARANR
jgi:hypothetical protein